MIFCFLNGVLKVTSLPISAWPFLQEQACKWTFISFQNWNLWGYWSFSHRTPNMKLWNAWSCEMQDPFSKNFHFRKSSWSPFSYSLINIIVLITEIAIHTHTHIYIYIYIFSSSGVLQLNSTRCRKTAIYMTDCRKNISKERACAQ